MRIDEKNKCLFCFFSDRCEKHRDFGCENWSPDETKCNFFQCYIDRDSDETEISRSNKLYSLQEAIDWLEENDDLQEGYSGRIDEITPNGESVHYYYEDGEQIY